MWTIAMAVVDGVILMLVMSGCVCGSTRSYGSGEQTGIGSSLEA
jgi:hypothetical protein